MDRQQLKQQAHDLYQQSSNDVWDDMVDFGLLQRMAALEYVATRLVGIDENSSNARSMCKAVRELTNDIQDELYGE